MGIYMSGLFISLGVMGITGAAFGIGMRASKRHAIHTIAKKRHGTYSYHSKPLVTSVSERNFFVKLQHAVHGSYYVFPKVHLCSILDHKLDGQDWHYARQHISGRTIDYVLCDKTTLRPVYAITFDDTHREWRTQQVDHDIERIFKEAELTLVRFAKKDFAEVEIVQALANAKLQAFLHTSSEAVPSSLSQEE